MKNPFKNEFAKNVSVIMSGSAISQALTIVATPLLTRLYDPNAFGVLAIFTSVIAIISVICSWKYELAVVLPKKDENAVSMFYISLFLIMINVILTSVIILLFGKNVIIILGIPELGNYIWWIPISILGVGLYNLFNYWTTRNKQYNRLAISRISRSTSQITLQALLSKTLSGAGLIVGHVSGQLTATITLGRFIIKKDRKKFTKPNIGMMKKQIKEYKEFPLYNTPQHFLNALSTNAAPFLLAYFFGAGIVGLYAISLKLLQLPISLVSNSLGQVFYQRASEMYNNGENVYKLLKRSTFYLGVISIIPWVIFIFIAPQLLGFILGEQWYEAGLYAQWIAIWMFFVLLNAPSVKTFIIFKLQRLHLFCSIIFFVLRISALIIGGFYYSPLITIQLFVFVSVLSNIFIITFAFYYTKKKQVAL